MARKTELDLDGRDLEGRFSRKLWNVMPGATRRRNERAQSRCERVSVRANAVIIIERERGGREDERAFEMLKT